MARSVVGAACGAGAATAYLRPDVVAGYVFDKWDMFPSRASRGSDYKRELDELSKLVQQLSRDVSGRQGVTIVHSGNEKSGYITYGVVIAGLGTVAYLRIFKGWRLSDFLYVTRRHLTQGLGKVNERIEGLSSRLLDVRNKLQAKLAEVIGKQNDTILAQRRLAEHLDRVGKEVETTGSQVRQIHGLVFDMDASLAEVGNSQRHTNHGIFILCKAVGELMAGHNLRSKAELLEFTRSPVWQGEELQGLGSLLKGDRESATSHRSFLLGSKSLPEPHPATIDRAFTSFEEESTSDDFLQPSRAATESDTPTAPSSFVAQAPGTRGPFKNGLFW